MRLLPDLLRLLRRLAVDGNQVVGVRLRLGLLPHYRGMPIDLIPDFIPVLGYADDAIFVVAPCGEWPDAPASTGSDTNGQAPTIASVHSAAWPA